LKETNLVLLECLECKDLLKNRNKIVRIQDSIIKQQGIIISACQKIDSNYYIIYKVLSDSLNEKNKVISRQEKTIKKLQKRKDVSVGTTIVLTLIEIFDAIRKK
jgi:hypothetical protein